MYKADGEPGYFHVVEDEWVLRSAISSLRVERVLALDTETTGLKALDDTLVLITLATDECAWVFHVNCREYWPTLKPILEDPTRTLLLQHAPFDFGFLLHHAGIDIAKANIYDTRVEEKVLAPGGKHSLTNLHSKYLGFPLDKSPQTTFRAGEPLTDEQARYAAIDALCLFPIALMQGLVRADRGHVRQDGAFRAMREYVEGRGAWPERR